MFSIFLNANNYANTSLSAITLYPHLLNDITALVIKIVTKLLQLTISADKCDTSVLFPVYRTILITFACSRFQETSKSVVLIAIDPLVTVKSEILHTHDTSDSKWQHKSRKQHYDVHGKSSKKIQA